MEEDAQSSGAERRLTGKQRAFIDAWFTNGFNGTRAAEAAGYSAGPSGKQKKWDRCWSMRASSLLGNARIQREIRRRWALRNGVTVEEVESVLSGQMRGRVVDVMDEDGNLDLETHGHLVEGVTLRADGSKAVKLYSAQRAAELIGKSLGMFRGDAEQVQLTVILDR